MEGLIFDASKKRLQTMTNEEWEKDEKEEKQEAPKRPRMVVKFPENKIKQLEELYSVVVVRDFGDEYHQTEKEKEENNELYKIFKPIRSHRSRYTNIASYVYAMRECIDFVKVLADKNRLIMDPNEFIEEVLSGKIEVSQLSFPSYKGKDRKDINWENVSKYIMNPELDPKELSEKIEINYIPVDIQENPEEHLKEYFSDDQIDAIFNDKDRHVSDTIAYDETIDDEPYGLVLPASKKDVKKLMKTFPDLIRPVKNAKMREQVGDSLRDFVFELDASAYEYIGRLDEKRGFMASDKIPQFTGNLASSKDVKKYLYQLEEFQDEHERINYNGRYITVSDYKDEILKEELSKAGWDVKNIYYNKEKEKKRKLEDKRDKKKEKRLRKELSKITDRRNRRNGNYTEGDLVNKKKKKHKKSSKKKADKFTDAVAKSKGAKDFEEYENMMLDMSSGYEG